MPSDTPHTDIPSSGASSGAAPHSEPPARTPRDRKPLAIGLAALALAVLAAVAVWIALGVPAGQASSADTVVLKDNVVIYDESDPAFTILAADEDSITVTSADALPEGSVLSAGVTDATPYGLLRIMGPAEPVEGGWRISTTQAALTDAIESCDVHFTVTMTAAGEYETRDAKTGETVMVAPAWAGEELDNLVDRDEGWYSLKAGNEVDLKLRIKDGQVSFTFADHVYAGFEMDWAQERSFESLDEAGNGEFEIFSKNLKPFTVPVGPVTLVFANELSGTLSVSGSASADVFRAGASLDKTFGFKYTSADGFIGIHEDDSESPGFEVETNGPALNLAGETEVAFSYTCLLYDLFGIRGSTGVQAEAECKAEIVDTQGAGTDLEAGVFEIPGTQIGAKGTFDAEASVPLKLDLYGHIPINIFDGAQELEGSINLFDTDDTLKIFDIHLPEKGADGSGSGGSGAGGSGSGGSTQQVSLPNTYVTTWQDVNAITYPAYTFSYPEGWSVVEEMVDQSMERVVLENADGARIVFSHLPMNPGGLGRFMSRYAIEPVAESAFIPEPIQATDFSGLGDFMVAKAVCTGSLYMDEDSSYEPIEGSEPLFAVLPASWTGTVEDLRGTPEVQFGFEYGDLIAFWGCTSETGDTERETAEIIATLSTFRVA